MQTTMASTKRKPTRKPLKTHEEEHDQSSVLFIRNMPPDVMEGLSQWVDEIRANSLGSENISRTELARGILTRLVRGQAVEPRKTKAE